MPGMCVHNLWADPCAGRQRAVHPAQANLRDFHPAFADGRQAALFERQAMAIGIEQGEVAMTGVWDEQRFKKAHGCVPVALHA